MKALKKYFSGLELALWIGSSLLIVASFLVFDRGSPLKAVASLIGVTSIIFSAKGNPIGQALMVVFSLIYGVVSYTFGYYGEMLTYLGMTMPMAAFSLIAWLRHPYNENRSEVRVSDVGRAECALMWLAAAAVTVAFYFILEAFGTANLIPSTVSVTTSFVAVYLTFRRSPFFALAYAANDAVLIILWALAARQNIGYISVVVCFVAFLMSDSYCFVSWQRMRRRQRPGDASAK